MDGHVASPQDAALKCRICGGDLDPNTKVCQVCRAWETGSERVDLRPSLALRGELERRYEVLAVLPRGGTSRVFKARDRQLGRIVALKVVAKGDDAESLLLQDARCAAAMRHKNIVEIHHVGQVESYTYVDMEFLEGGSLADRLAQTGRLSDADAIATMTPILDALEHVHRGGLYHMDVKCSNILFRGDGTPVLADFGIARPATNGTGRPSGPIRCTPQYASPEQLLGSKDLDRRSDIYSVGAALYELVTGRPPFIGDTPMEIHALVTGTFPAGPRTLNPQVSEAMERVLLRCLQKRPDARYQDCESLKAALLGLVGAPVSLESAPPEMSRTPPLEQESEGAQGSEGEQAEGVRQDETEQASRRESRGAVIIEVRDAVDEENQRPPRGFRRIRRTSARLRRLGGM